ncbi:MAG: type II toxin-antitoxin system Phd/YefM family antitoxin, partial [Ramlibacter sp.]
MQVTATEAKNRFGYFCSQAKSEPVVVEKDGRPDTVLVDYEEFQALRAAAVQLKSDGRGKKEFYKRYKDWVDMQNDLVERFGIPG